MAKLREATDLDRFPPAVRNRNQGGPTMSQRYLRRTRAAAVAATACLLIAAQAQAGKVPPPEISPDFAYPSRTVEVLGSRMHYVEAGAGDPIVFLHGQPTSSYLWRNVMPHLEPLARVIAPDNIGFGKSAKPDIAYTYGDHMRHIEGLIDALALDDITFVVHDWGSAMGFDYAARHPDKVKGIAFMEAIMAPLFPAESYDALPPPLAEFFSTMRDPVKGPELMVEQNYFVEVVLPSFTSRDIDEVAMAVYREPFLDKQSRWAINSWPNQVPIGGEPAEVVEVVANYNRWLMETETPLLFLYASPGALNPPEIADWWVTRARNMETVFIGAGLHYVQEDQPYAIGRAIADWYRRIDR
jgi:haloalkane dehalogenase